MSSPPAVADRYVLLHVLYSCGSIAFTVEIYYKFEQNTCQIVSMCWLVLCVPEILLYEVASQIYASTVQYSK